MKSKIFDFAHLFFSRNIYGAERERGGDGKARFGELISLDSRSIDSRSKIGLMVHES